MGARKSKVIELDAGDLMGKSVEQLDSELTAIWAYAAMALSLRQHKAAAEKITTPAPAPPTLILDTNVVSAASPRINQARRAQNALPNPPKHVTWIAGSTVHAAYTIIGRFARGVDLPTYREEFEKLHTGEDAAAHSRALRTLRSTGHAVFYKKKVFTYDCLKQFLADVETGAVEDLPDTQPTLHGKWAVAVYEFIRSHNGDWVEFRDIVTHIERQPGFDNLANVQSQVAVALKNLQYRHHTVEKMKGRNTSQYRIKPSEQEGDGTYLGAEISAAAQ